MDVDRDRRSIEPSRSFPYSVSREIREHGSLQDYISSKSDLHTNKIKNIYIYIF